MSRILLVSDIHANLAALETVLADSESRESIDEVWSLGDAVGYGPQPNECLERLRVMGAVALTGNHELAALGLISVDDFNPYARAAALWTAEVLADESKQFAASLKSKYIVGDFTLVHGSPRDPVWEYLDSSVAAAANFPLLETRNCVNGHTHVPMVIPIAGRLERMEAPVDGQLCELGAARWFINPGSVGQPRDGDARASYAVLDNASATVTFHRIEYPVEQTQHLMQQVGLPEILWQRLSMGR